MAIGGVESILRSFGDIFLPKELDLTGKHLPLPEIPFGPTHERRKNFLTPERKELGRRVVEDLCQRTAGYGVKPFRFSPWHLKVVGGEDSRGRANAHNFTGRITLCAGNSYSEGQYVKTLAHEYYHTVSTRRLAKKGDRRRFGLVFAIILETNRNIQWLGEGIVEKSARITANRLGFFDFEKTSGERVKIIEMMCLFMATEKLAEKYGIPSFTVLSKRRPEAEAIAVEVFSLFEEAIYGQGNVKPLFTSIQRYYKGVGGIKRFFQLTAEAGRLRRENLEDEEERVVYQLTNFALGIRYGVYENRFGS